MSQLFIESSAPFDHLLAHQYGGGLALEVDELLAAHVDGDAMGRAAGEAPGPFTGVGVGHARRTIASDAQAFSGEHELAGLGLDLGLADVGVGVPEREVSVDDR